MDMLHLTVVVMFMVSAVSLSISRRFSDEMFQWFSIAFLLFGLSRLMHIHFTWSPTEAFDVRLFSVLMLYGAGSTSLATGAINGRRVYKETPLVMLLAIVVSSFVASADKGASSYPLAFALFVGGFTAAWFLLRRGEGRCSYLYSLIGVGIFGRGIAAIVSSTMTRYDISFIRGYVVFADLLLLLFVLASMVMLAKQRITDATCEEEGE